MRKVGLLLSSCLPVIEPMVLSAPLVQSVQSSKEARRALRETPVQWLELEVNDIVLSRQLQDAIPVPSRPYHGDPDFKKYNEESKEEFKALYAKDRMDPANNELSPLLSCLVLRALGQEHTQSFLDIGASRGSLVLCAAASGHFHNVAGLELSHRSHREALKAFNDFNVPINTIPRFFQGDLRIFPHYADYDLIYCAIRGPKSRPAILDQALTHIFSDTNNFPYSRRKRFVCAGFGLDIKQKPYAPYLRLIKAYCIKRFSSSAQHDEKSSLEAEASYDLSSLHASEPLYGDNEGPRVLLEYELLPPSPTLIDKKLMTATNSKEETAASNVAQPSSSSQSAQDQLDPQERHTGLQQREDVSPHSMYHPQI